MNNYKRLGKNTLLVFVGNMGSKLIALLMLPFYTRWLSVEEYGTADNVLVYVTLLLGIVTLSIPESIFIFPKDQEKSKQKEYFSSGFLYSAGLLLIAGVLLFGLKEFFLAIDIIESFTSNVGFIYLWIIAFFIQIFSQQFSRSIDKIKVYAISGLVLTISTAIFSFTLIPYYGLNGFFLAQIFSFLLSGLYTLIHSGSYKYFSFPSVKMNIYKEMTRYSVPLIPNAIMWWLVISLNRPIMEEYLGMNAVGVFAVANKLPSLITVLFSVLLVSWQISVIEEHKKESYELFYNRVLKVVFALLVCIVITLSLLGPMLIEVIADQKFYEAWEYIPLLSLAALFSAISGFVGTNFSATRESKYYFYSSVWGAIAAIAFNFLLIPMYGIHGAVIAIALSQLIMLVFRIKYSWRTVKITNPFFYLILLILGGAIYSSINLIENNVVLGTLIIFQFGLGYFLLKSKIFTSIKLLKPLFYL